MSYTNKEVANLFLTLGKLMELHGESPFKTRAYDNAYRLIRGHAEPVIDMSVPDLQEIPGIGKAIAEKIGELKATGTMQTLERYMDMTPEGVRDMLQMKGLGPKKIYQIWKEIGAETVGELLYACNENRLVALKGFGAKTQEDIAAKAKFFLNSRGQMHYAKAWPVAQELLITMRKVSGDEALEFCGELRRKNPVIKRFDFIGTTDAAVFQELFDEWAAVGEEENIFEGKLESITCRYIRSAEDRLGTDLWIHTAEKAFLEAYHQGESDSLPAATDEADLCARGGFAYVLPERREVELLGYPDILKSESRVAASDIKGVIHAHSQYSDGASSLKEMAQYCQGQGYEYLVITDHSKAAFYANGLGEVRLKEQWDEIDSLNGQMTGFRIFKGIEADILSDGSLDYDESVWPKFEVIIASIHSNLRMDEEKATMRLINAIENPYTTMLGHPTGRLLLSRAAYPIDHRKVIDAAAANQVAIEINANPYRLDLDWTWIPYALSRGVKLSINPDAHSLAGVGDIEWGIPVADKGGADKENLLCCMNLEEFALFVQK